ncbi:bifunctional heptose 7-phosphate kinase/heptose 1-phosphate adenyltransferase [Pectinatus haikarae]|uniref:RfaE bifunctional protein kinase chain/domain n=1 Tax=Pectinatus haikarae TaxID=349096 RepID=A0ABT9Y7E0_9FIRM|nr:PfkB family carbohydrate kinase [Pectinatus haikarae]MDQ0203461.1 rfaE bifunctional protein kinase chain/domain [Pectinatus haikarae]
MENRKNLLSAVLSGMQNKHIAVIGDMVADIYLHCTIDRISREAPVLVLKQAEEKIVAGGAANVVNNIATLGGCVSAVGLLGSDSAGAGLKNILTVNGVGIDGMLVSAKGTTITKTRIIAGGRATVSQQVVRIDHDNNTPISPSDETLLLEKLRMLLPKIGGIVLSDYGSGTITPAVRELAINYSQKNNVPCIVDSRYDIESFAGVTYVKQNDAELASAVNSAINTETDLYNAGFLLLKKLKAKGILVTCGEKGMVLFEENGKATRIPVSDKSEVYDVSGAGDTCVAAFILAVAAGYDPSLAAKLSNYAAGIAVRKMGTATVAVKELKNILEK